MKQTSLSLAGKHIIVTGGAQGIGRSIVELALQLDASVTAVDMNGDGLRAFAEEAGSDRLVAAVGSVADPDFVAATVRDAIAHAGKVDGLVNNAGIVRAAMIEKMSLDAWRQVIDVHLTGSFLFLKEVGVHLLGRARAGENCPGSIVNISSDAGRKGTIGQINYGTAKAGVMGMTMSAAREWGRYGIRVNSVGFGAVETPMTETIRDEKFRDGYLAQIPLGRFGMPDEAAWPVCFLLSDVASYITGQHISPNGGATMG